MTIIVIFPRKVKIFFYVVKILQNQTYFLYKKFSKHEKTEPSKYDFREYPSSILDVENKLNKRNLRIFHIDNY